MTENVFELVKKKAPSDLSAELRALADAVDRGEILDMIGAYTQNGSYCFLYGASLIDGIVMSSMLQANCLNRMRR